MTAHLSDLIDLDDLAQHIADGLVRERTHLDDVSLRILNYTEKAQYENVWNRTTLTCRGLIVRGDDVLARPWRKFFNYGQHPEGTLHLDAPVEVTDKLDGSLGILYAAPDGGWAIATRGSFASEQAEHATELLRRKYLPDGPHTFRPTPGWTYLFEIVYPDNRIVVDYGPLDDLLLLGAVRTEDGDELGPRDVNDWPGPRTRSFEATTLADALALPPRPNAEGVVVRFFETGVMVKLKQDDYAALHRLVTGLSERTVWEHLTAHAGAYDELLAAIPDEFHDWVRVRAEALRAEHDRALVTARAGHAEILAALPAAHERRDYAFLASQRPERALLFNLLDGRDPSPAIWKSLKPVGSTPMRRTSEDVA